MSFPCGPGPRRPNSDCLQFHIGPRLRKSFALIFEGGINAHFRGLTDDHIEVAAKCVGGRALALDRDGSGTVYFAPHALKTFPELKGNATEQECKFLVANFAFSPFTQLGEHPHHPPPHIFPLDLDGQRIELEIHPLDDYVDRIVRLQQARSILPTASLIVKADAAMPVMWHHDLASKLCRLISVAAGTLVEWISADGFDPELNKHYRFHSKRVTKPFCSLPTVPIKEFSYQANTHILRTFLQAGLKGFGQRDDQYLDSVIAAFLDARLEGDFLETRGIKTAVTLEIIKNGFVDTFISEQWNSTMPAALRKQVVRVTKAALKAEGLSAETINIAAQALGQLERPPLRRIVDHMLSTLSLSQDKVAVDAVVAIRNRLVHTGQFISNNNAKKANQFQITDAVNEFYMLLSFVDRLLLRILGHAGPSIDYSSSNRSGVQMVIS